MHKKAEPNQRELSYQETLQKLIETANAWDSEKDGRITVSKLAKRLGLSHQTGYNYVNDSPELQSVIHTAKEGNLDFVEDRLFDEIKAKEHVPMLFFLKTQGKHRGWVERQEYAGEGGKPIIFQIVTDEECKGMLDDAKERLNDGTTG